MYGERRTLLGNTMTGFRKESFYIEKYSATAGTEKYQQVISNLTTWWNNDENK